MQHVHLVTSGFLLLDTCSSISAGRSHTSWVHHPQDKHAAVLTASQVGRFSLRSQTGRKQFDCDQSCTEAALNHDDSLYYVHSYHHQRANVYDDVKLHSDFTTNSGSLLTHSLVDLPR